MAGKELHKLTSLSEKLVLTVSFGETLGGGG